MATGTFVSDELSVDLVVAPAVEMLDAAGIEGLGCCDDGLGTAYSIVRLKISS
jgi:hypothetical protein